MATTADQEQAERDRASTTRGVIYALLAYSQWAVLALFFKLLEHISPIEIVAHRAIWSIPTAGIALLAMGRTKDIIRAFRTPRLLAVLFFTALLIASNWGLFVWAVAQGRTLEASLGYYINPLLNVAVGYVLLGERLTRVQALAVGLAALAVAIQTVMTGVAPWLALFLAATFCAYGYVRRTIDVGPAQGYFVEAVLLAVVGVVILATVPIPGGVHFGRNAYDTLLLIACGPVTSIPLMLFSAAARRIRFATLGLLQYIAPSGLFLAAVFAFGEPVGTWQLVAFLLIWTALALYSLEAWRVDAAARAGT